MILVMEGGSDPDGRDLLGDWRRMMESLLAAVPSVGSAAEIPRQLIEQLQRQTELMQEAIERERALRRQIAGRLLAPADLVFDLLEESAVMLRRQAQALETAGRALEETAGVAKGQAELFERTIGALREPTELAKSAMGLERRPKPAPRKPRGRPRKK
jgi:hypothetical protein